MSASSSYSSRTRPRVAIAELARQDNRTKYLVYAYEGTGRHDLFLNRLFRRIPAQGLTRPQLKRVVEEIGDGRYGLYYNTIVVNRVADVRRRLF